MIDERLPKLFFWSTPGIGLQTYRKVDRWVVANRLTWSDWWGSGQDIWLASGLKVHQLAAVVQQKTTSQPEEYFTFLQKKEIWVVAETDSMFPDLLAQTPDHPPFLFGRGDRQLLSLPKKIAVVGTRKMTSYGQLATERLVSDFVTAGIMIVSGFMYGVDVMAHQISDRCQQPSIGVLGYGFDHVYPTNQTGLLAQLLAKGHTFITEYPPGLAPNRGTFVQRNRLIAGLSQAVIVTEAGLKSGSHSTAQFGLGYGRVIGAVPGPITNPYSQGTKWLINQGAFLVTSAEDVIDELGWSKPGLRNTLCQNWKHEVNSTPGLILVKLREMSQTVDQLAGQCQVPVADILAALTQLELKKMVKKDGGKWLVC